MARRARAFDATARHQRRSLGHAKANSTACAQCNGAARHHAALSTHRRRPRNSAPCGRRRSCLRRRAFQTSTRGIEFAVRPLHKWPRVSDDSALSHAHSTSRGIARAAAQRDSGRAQHHIPVGNPSSVSADVGIRSDTVVAAAIGFCSILQTCVRVVAKREWISFSREKY